MPILVHFKAKNNDNSYFYKNSGLSFQWVPYYVKEINNVNEFRGGSRISGKRAHICKVCVGVALRILSQYS